MKGKKLEKRVQFIFKKKSIVDLNKEQMKKVNGGDGIRTTGGVSIDPGCTVSVLPTVSEQ